MPKMKLLESSKPKVKDLPAASEASTPRVYQALRKAESIRPTTDYWQKLKDTLGGMGIPGVGNPESNTYRGTELGGSLMPASAMTLSRAFTKKQLWDQAEKLIKRIDNTRKISLLPGPIGNNIKLLDDIEREIYKAPRTAGLINKISIDPPDFGGSVGSSSGKVDDLLEYPFKRDPSGISSRFNADFLDFSNPKIPEGKLMPPFDMRVSSRLGYNVPAHEFTHVGQIAQNPQKFFGSPTGYAKTKTPFSPTYIADVPWEMRPEEHLADLRSFITANPEVKNIKGLGNRLASMYTRGSNISSVKNLKDVQELYSLAPTKFFRKELMPYLNSKGLLTKDTEYALTQALYNSFK